jgi:hypothetical protein
MNRKPAFLFLLAGVLLLAACEKQGPPRVLPTDLPATPPPTAAADSASATESVVPTSAATESVATPSAAAAANADVTFVRAVQAADGTWTFYVTVAHPDTGWEDYADGWDVVTPDGTVLKPDPDSDFTRLLLHPHVDEQPFTRSQGGITIPEGVSRVTVRAHDLVAGYGGRQVEVDLTAASGPGFEVER